MAGITNAMFDSKIFGGLLKKSVGVAEQRSLPRVYSVDFDKELQKAKGQSNTSKSKVVLYIDEFTNYMDVGLGKDAIEVLTRLGYEVELFYAESGRTYISKGFLKQAKKLAIKNLEKLSEITDKGLPILGLEPSAILTFRDEYKRFGFDKKRIDAIAPILF